jgi:hypothetical protein
LHLLPVVKNPKVRAAAALLPGIVLFAVVGGAYASVLLAFVSVGRRKSRLFRRMRRRHPI